LPVLLGNVSHNVVDWVQILLALATNQPVPAWWPTALLLFTIAFAFALGA
jgi:hypothetical protein